MSFLISISASEQPNTIRSLLHDNLLGIFNERDVASRSAMVKRLYAPDIVWYEENRYFLGPDAISARAGQLLAENPTFSFVPDGEMGITMNLGVIPWKFGPPETPDMVKGYDVILVQSGTIKGFWTALTKQPPT